MTSTARGERRKRGRTTVTPRILITGTGAVCGPGTRSRGDARSRSSPAARRSRPIKRWDTTGWPITQAAEIADFNARSLVDDRKLHKFIRRTDLVGIYAGDRAAEAAGYRGAPRDARRRRIEQFRRSNRRLRRLGRRDVREPVRLLSADERREGRPAHVRPRAGRHGEPDVAAAHAAEQRAVPCRHPQSA